MRSWSSNTWVLGVFAVILLLVAVDIGRRMTAGPAAPSEGSQAQASQLTFKVGDRAPDFTLPDKDKKELALSSLVHGDTLLFFLCGCSNCRAVQVYAGALGKEMGDKAPALVGVTSTKPDFEPRYLSMVDLKEKLLYEKEDKKVMNMYQGHPCPRIYRLDKDRRVTWISPSLTSLDPTMGVMQIGAGLAEELGFAPVGTTSVGKKTAPVMEPPEGMKARRPTDPNPGIPKPPPMPNIPPDKIPPGPGERVNRFRGAT